MTPPIGFALVTHKNPAQIIRLIAKLNEMFDHPPIACHHDYYKSELPVDLLTSNVTLVQPHLRTSWGAYTVCEAMLRAIALLYASKSPPEWFILLSEADYPIKSAQTILNDLRSSKFDVHLKHEHIDHGADTDWRKLCYDRYFTIRLQRPHVDRKLRLTSRTLHLKQRLITRAFLPFSEELRCFAGEVWFCANRKAAEYLLDFHHKNPKLAYHYRRMDPYQLSPDESYHHTILCNAPHLTISDNNWRYVDWSAGGPHPKILGLEDLTLLEQSTAHFARKFDMTADPSIFEKVDNIIK